MKKNIITKIFIVFIIALMGLAIYIIYNGKWSKDNKEDYTLNENIQNTEYSKEINIGISNFDNINPLITNNKEVINISKLIFESLVELDENYVAKMCLAKEIAKINSKSYLIKINNEIKWEDGDVLTIDDIEYTINALKEGKSIYSENVINIKNTQRIDNQTLRIDLENEDCYFQYKMIFPIMQKKYYNNESLYTSSKIPKGTGIYKIKEITAEKVILELNENRRNKTVNPKIETINIFLFSDMGELYNSFKIGNIDIINTSNINYQKYIGTIGYKVKEYKGRNYDFLSLNCNNELFNKKEVRKAISYAIDKSEIVSSVYNNQYCIADNPLDFGSYLYTSENLSLGYNPEQTKKILSEDGWKVKNEIWQKEDSKGDIIKLDFNLVVQSSNQDRVKVAEIIKEELKEVNINVNIKEVSDEQYTKYLNTKDYDIILTGISNGFDQNIEYFYGENNLANYKNENVKKDVLESRNITNIENLKEKYKSIFENVQDDMPYIGLYRNKNFIIQNKNVNGDIKPNNYSLFYYIETWYK